jgi:hypothetical protein
MDPARCSRCGRENPEFDPAFPEDDCPTYWEVLDGNLVCDHCITGEEQQRIDEDYAEGLYKPGTWEPFHSEED